MGDPVTTIAVLNNAISVTLAGRDLEERGVDLGQVAVILTREVDAPWLERCAKVVRYGGKPSGTLWGQARFASFYREAASTVRGLCASPELRNIYIINNDNLLTAHLLRCAEVRKDLEVTVVAEGLMNFQEITVKNRESWRWRVKPVISVLLGLKYRTPTGHLSGAFEAVVSRVVSFAKSGLKAPPEKIVVRGFPLVPVRVAPKASVGLIVHTGLWQWMSEERYLPFAQAFADWVKAQRFRKLYVKPHPRIETGILDYLLPEHEVLTTSESLEDIAGDLEAATVMGTCCTGLVTLKLIRPDLKCIDFGGDYYCEHAYHGDYSVLDLLRATDVELVSFHGLHETGAGSDAAFAVSPIT